MFVSHLIFIIYTAIASKLRHIIFFLKLFFAAILPLLRHTLVAV